MIPALRTEPCVCGGAITAPEGDWPATRNAVQLHQLAARHQRWREWLEVEQHRASLHQRKLARNRGYRRWLRAEATLASELRRRKEVRGTLTPI